jgi:hypothetical protein
MPQNHPLGAPVKEDDRVDDQKQDGLDARFSDSGLGYAPAVGAEVGRVNQ